MTERHLALILTLHDDFRIFLEPPDPDPEIALRLVGHVLANREHGDVLSGRTQDNLAYFAIPATSVKFAEIRYVDGAGHDVPDARLGAPA